ncbi:MAG: hypothetical protein AB7S81_07195 [Bdellovibrionales bacterium]
MEPRDEYVLPQRSGGRMCLLECRKVVARCLGGCELDRRACFVGMQNQAMSDYDDYTRQQFRERKPIELRASEFERPEKCVVSSCKGSCISIYNQCFEKCGGKIIGNPVPVFSAF